MKKLLLILLCLPFISVSQTTINFSKKEKKYERTMSVSQFAKELKQAAEKGDDYTLENCEITYDTERDKHLDETDSKYRINNIMEDAVLQNIRFNDSSKVTITNCKFGDPDTLLRFRSITLKFRNCDFGELEFLNVEVNRIFIDSSNIFNTLSFKRQSEIINHYNHYKLDITKSNVNSLWAESNTQESIETVLWVFGSKINYMTIGSFDRVHIANNEIKTVLFGGIYLKHDYNFGTIRIRNNHFDSTLSNVTHISINKINEWKVHNYNGIFVSNAKINTLTCSGNQIKSIDSFNFNFDQEFDSKPLRVIFSSRPIWLSKKISEEELVLEGLKYNDTFDNKKKIAFLKDYYEKNKVKLHFNQSGFNIINASIENLFLKREEIDFLTIYDNEILKKLSISEINVDSLIIFSSNSLPDYNRINLDNTLFKNLGFKWQQELFYGFEDFGKVQELRKVDGFVTASANLTETYRLFINILTYKGSDLKTDIIIKLKDILTHKNMYEYYENQTLNNWFNWRGSQFLKLYSDYGTNPFKALAYCFWAMLYFAMFYFFFYSEWDKIDRGFLIKRFNSVMDYFTTEKRIEDFYSSKHDKEMTTFTEFKDTLEKNKVYMPAMLGALAKPIYQISLLRYKLLSFSYKKAEFMAGRKWVDLEKKDRYWIGTLTFFLTLTYIIYLIFIRALNSIVLSINAFSTLGFGQIPVRGFTKYVAIIEGFIGWFLLSVFIVSLLSQMMSI